MASIIDILTSRTLAIVLMLLMVAALAGSAFLPSQAFLTSEEWEALSVQKPALFWLASRLSTPILVKSPVFAVLALFLSLSTLSCTIRRMFGWERHKATAPVKDKYFTFAVEGQFNFAPQEALNVAAITLRSKGWVEAETSHTGQITGQKGAVIGFWGSVAFHGALIICLVAAVVSYLTSFNGQMILTEGITLPLHEAVGTSHTGNIAALPPAQVKVDNLEAVYKEGHFKYDFSGVLHLIQGRDRMYPFKVNAPATIEGLQFSLQQFGFSPRLVIKGGSGTSFDYHLNLRHEDGDYFPLESPDLKLFVVFFPEFDEKDGKIGTLSREVKNPRLLIKILQGEKVLHRALLAPGEKLPLGSYMVQFAELKSWALLSISKEPGLVILMAGLLLLTMALFVRFLSNERRIILSVQAGDDGTSFHLQGFSRYYPASLEREMVKLAEMLSGRKPLQHKEEI